MFNTSKKPLWLTKKINLKETDQLKKYFKGSQLHTVCQEALCPNISECFARKQATFLILGDVCTRGCTFCNIKKGAPQPLEYSLIPKIKDAVLAMGLRHVVITSVTRDDLHDGGADFFYQTVQALKTVTPLTIELLIPDFNADIDALKTVASAKPDIIAHNIETVPRLYPAVRKKAGFTRSLQVLAAIKKIDPRIHTKSGLMLGLGEKKSEVLECFGRLRGVECDFLSIGQYLQPSLQHTPVIDYIPEEDFLFYKNEALRRGFRRVASGPYVRSSYMAEEYLANIK